MKVKDLKVGMILEVNGLTSGNKDFCMVLPLSNNLLCASGKNQWFLLKDLNDNLENSVRKVVKVWGLSRTYANAHCLGTEDRELLWERKELKELTVSQIEELLGYPVKIVKEG